MVVIQSVGGTWEMVHGWRGTARIESDRPWETSPTFNGVNRNKYGITLDLSNPKGVDIFKILVKVSEVVIENFTPRVMPNFGLDYESLKKMNAGIFVTCVASWHVAFVAIRRSFTKSRRANSGAISGPTAPTVSAAVPAARPISGKSHHFDRPAPSPLGFGRYVATRMYAPMSILR